MHGAFICLTIFLSASGWKTRLAACIFSAIQSQEPLVTSKNIDITQTQVSGKKNFCGPATDMPDFGL
eukprot:1149325-Pelagomonas_calceolata.AAC.14